MQKIEGKKVVVKVEAKDIKRLEKIQKRHKITQSQAVRNILAMGLDVYEDLAKIGVPQTVALFDGMKKIMEGITVEEIDYDQVSNT